MKQTKQGQQTPKQPNFFMRLLAFLVSVALVLGAVLLVVNWDKLNIDALRRWLSYRSVQTSQLGLSERFTHGGGDRLEMACLDSGYLFSSTAGAHFYSSGGVELGSQVVRMEQPVLSANGQYGVVYDAGGSSLFRFGGHKEPVVYDGSAGDVLSARVNENGWLTVTSLPDHYRGGVTVYNPSNQPVIALNVSSAFVTDAILSPDGKTVAVVTIRQEGGVFQSTLHLYRTDEEESFNTVVLDGFTVLDMDFDSHGLWLLGDTSLITLDKQGQQRQEYHFDPAYLKGYALEGDGFAVLTLGKYRAGAAKQLVVVGHDAQPVAQQELTASVLSLTASGRYVALLTGQELTIYTDDLNVYSTLDDTQSARYAALHNDGSVLLANRQEAWLYIPD